MAAVDMGAMRGWVGGWVVAGDTDRLMTPYLPYLAGWAGLGCSAVAAGCQWLAGWLAGLAG